MPELHTFLFASGASVDPLTNQLTVSGLLDVVIPLGRISVNPPTPPNQNESESVLFLGPGVLVTTWMRSDENEPREWEQKVDVIAPDGIKTEWQAATSINLTGLISFVIHRMNIITIQKSGAYTLELRLRRAGHEDWSDPITRRRFYVQDPAP